MLNQAQRGTLIAALGISMLSCGQNQQNGMSNQAPEYAVMTVDTSKVDLNTSYSAKLRGKQDIEIRPNVSGFITKVCVDEGATVKKGETLFIIDPVQYEEAVKVAEAAVNVAKANVATAELTAENKRELARKNIISQYDLQTAENCGILSGLFEAQQNIRVWRSLVSRLNGVQEASSSNLDTRTI